MSALKSEYDTAMMTPGELTTNRKSMGLTKAELARRLGMGRKQITRYEAGEYPIPVLVILAIRQLKSKT